MQVKITIDCDNAAFEDAPATEIARILRKAATRVEHGYDDFPLKDINGDTVGRLVITN